MKNLQYKNFIHLISAYINQDYSIDIYNPDWDEIYTLSTIHNLSGIVYSVLINSNVCNNMDALNKFKQSFYITIARSTIQDVETNELIEILNYNEIQHILFKGFVLKNYYPNKELRTMGDIDIAINECNQNKVHELLLKNNYIFDEPNSHRDVRNYCKNGVTFEIHCKIINANAIDNINYIDYFDKFLLKTELISHYSYEFIKEYHLIYLITHMAHHFKISGCGVRMLSDLAIFINKFHEFIDWKYIKQELEKLELFNFTITILSICKVWFGTSNPYASEIKDLEAIENYIIKGGTFGHNDRNVDAIRIKNKGKITPGIFRFIFPSYEHLNTRYVWFKKMPKWMLPIGWIKYWHYRLFVVKEQPFKRIGNAIKSNSDAIEHETLMKFVGL